MCAKFHSKSKASRNNLDGFFIPKIATWTHLNSQNLKIWRNLYSFVADYLRFRFHLKICTLQTRYKKWSVPIDFWFYVFTQYWLIYGQMLRISAQLTVLRRTTDVHYVYLKLSLHASASTIGCIQWSCFRIYISWNWILKSIYISRSCHPGLAWQNWVDKRDEASSDYLDWIRWCQSISRTVVIWCGSEKSFLLLCYEAIKMLSPSLVICELKFILRPVSL